MPHFSLDPCGFLTWIIHKTVTQRKVHKLDGSKERYTVVVFQLHSCRRLFQAVLWRYKFSQLKGSSDDGKSKIKFLFQNQDSKSIEAKVIKFDCVSAACEKISRRDFQSNKVMENELLVLICLLLQELEFSNLFAVLHCIHAFFAAKVACLDPMFVESQGTATTTGIPSLSGLSCNSQTPKLKYTTWQALLSPDDAALNHERGLRWWTGGVQTMMLWGTTGVRNTLSNFRFVERLLT